MSTIAAFVFNCYSSEDAKIKIKYAYTLMHYCSVFGYLDVCVALVTIRLPRCKPVLYIYLCDYSDYFFFQIVSYRHKK